MKYNMKCIQRLQKPTIEAYTNPCFVYICWHSLSCILLSIFILIEFYVRLTYFLLKGKIFFSCMGNNHKVPPSITTNWPPSDRYLQPTGNMHFWMFSPTLWFGKNQELWKIQPNWWASITVSSRISSQRLLQCFQCNCLSTPKTLKQLQKLKKKNPRFLFKTTALDWMQLSGQCPPRQTLAQNKLD